MNKFSNKPKHMPKRKTEESNIRKLAKKMTEKANLKIKFMFFVVALLAVFYLFLAMVYDSISLFFNLVIPTALVLPLAVYFFSSKSYRSVKMSGNSFELTVHIITSVLLLIVVAIVSFVLTFLVFFGSGFYT